MFFLTGGIAVIICAVIEFCFFCKSKKVLSCIGVLIKHAVIDLSVGLTLLTTVFGYQHFIDSSAYNTSSFIKFGLLTLGVGLILAGITAIIKGSVAFEEEKLKKNKKGKIAKGPIICGILAVLIVFLGCFCLFGTEWSKDSFGEVTAEQFVINMTSPIEAEGSIWDSIYEGPFIYTMAITSVFAFIVLTSFKIVYNGKRKKLTLLSGFWKRLICLVLALTYLGAGLVHGIKEFNLIDIYNAYTKTSTIIEDNYVNPKTANLVFPEKKRNLIHIYLESMENSYMSKEYGGFMDTNLIPELTELAQEGYVFSDSDNKFGGPLTVMGTQWSVASMVNQTTGLPMKMPNEANKYGTAGNFMPGAWTLMDILTEQGYEQTVMFGADRFSGGLAYYYETHGNVTLFDWRYAKENGLIPEDYKEYWGYEDDKLYQFAKDEITRLYETGKPFNFTMETADTHFPGYIGENTPTPYSSTYANALAYSSSEAYSFIRWIQEQPFYENTTIVIIGDHLSMDTTFFEEYDFPEDYNRTQYNLILNPAPNVDTSNANLFINRKWANFDYFPTILASMGVQIEGDVLGVGTNLFSGKKTMSERYDYDELNAELQKKSALFDNEILQDPHASDVLFEETTAEVTTTN